MSTNYYRIPKTPEVVSRIQKFNVRMQELDYVSPASVHNEFKSIWVDEYTVISPWEELTSNLNVHLGKRSSGWKFLWNWNDSKYYSNKEELVKFVRSGRVVDEYGRDIPVEEFLKMSFEWGQEDGWDDETYHKEHPDSYRPSFLEHRKEQYIDGLRVAPYTDFS